ncbi:MAG: hypothetical protein ACD_4C00293G0001, partial [uncultured bacterium (gcode 4)]
MEPNSILIYLAIFFIFILWIQWIMALYF